jgi:hypothetical protein
MFDQTLRSITLLTALGIGVVASVPAYACHLATGWCCLEDGPNYFCCYYSNDQLQKNTCGYVQPT